MPEIFIKILKKNKNKNWSTELLFANEEGVPDFFFLVLHCS